MKNPFLGLKAGILTQLIFVIVAAMLLINVAMLNLYEGHLIREKEQTGKTLITAVVEILKISYSPLIMLIALMLSQSVFVDSQDLV